MPAAPQSARLQACIVDCLECYSVCRQEAMQQCLEAGDGHVRPQHFRLMHECAEMCRTAADLMLSGSAFHVQACAVCALVCDACARSCDELRGMESCARACRGCAHSCRELSQG